MSQLELDTGVVTFADRIRARSRISVADVAEVVAVGEGDLDVLLGDSRAIVRPGLPGATIGLSILEAADASAYFGEFLAAVLSSEMADQFVRMIHGDWTVDVIKDFPLFSCPAVHARQLRILVRRRWRLDDSDGRDVEGSIERVVMEVYGLGTDDAMNVQRMIRADVPEAV